MSQNGPYPGQGWQNGGPPGSEEPYTEPADPWGDAQAPDHAWGGQPLSVPPTGTAYTPAAYPSGPLDTPPPLNTPPPWQQPPMPLPRKRRNAPIIALVVVLGLLICGGLGTTAWLVSRGGTADGASGPTVPATTATNEVAAPEPQTSEDARFVKKGQCVRNQGNADDSPDLKIVSCTTGTYQVLKRVDGRTTGEADAENKCGKVQQYTKWYFYDSELDSLDFVLCLKEYGAG